MRLGLDNSQRFAAGEFRYLLDFVDATDYRVVDCLAQRNSRERRTLSLRYDVHWRDIRGAYGFIEVHRERATPGSFFLLHDYSRIERQREADFVALAGELNTARSAGIPVELGFHDSPVDRYLMWSQTDGDEARYVAWLAKGDGLNFFRRLERDPGRREEFNAAVQKSFVASVRAARRALGAMALSACHGGKLSQVLRPKLPELGTAGDIIRACFAENWLTPARLAAAELVGDVECFKKEAPEIASITEGGGRLVRMCDSLVRYTAVGRPLVALVHPASWDQKSNRDGEWSRLLTLPKREPQRIVVSVNPQTLLRELRDTPDSKLFDRALYTESAKVDEKLAPELEARVTRHQLLLELLSDPRHATEEYEVTWGQSLRRYGATVLQTLEACLHVAEVKPRAAALARWVEREVNAVGSKARLTSGELAYFLFSSAQRGSGLSAIVRQFWRSTGPLRYVDHGAGIGFIALLLGADVPLASVRCSEVKPQFIDAGQALWASLEQGELISFTRCSVTEFVYESASDVVFFGHMLYRVPPEQRGTILRAAIQSLAPGGLLVVNELMNRPELDATYAHPCLTSDELLTLIEAGGALTVHSVDASGAELKTVPARERPAEFFRRSDNFVVAVRA